VPIYEYGCDSCHHRFEVRQSFNDPPIAACERCGQAVRKLISPPAIMFKGSGWYVTDYSDKLKPKTDGAPAEANGKPAAPAPSPGGANSAPATSSTAPASAPAAPAKPASESKPSGSSSGSTT
jgi:putative FmdB family regulatory protein